MSDGIFAIAMTLLVLQIDVPVLSGHSTSAELWQAIVKLGPSVAGYAVSFLLLGTLWVAHHSLFHFVRHVDRAFLWMNIAFLMCVAFIPFSTALLADYHDQPLASAVYGLTILVAACVLYVTFNYATKGRRLVVSELDDEIIAAARRRLRLGMAAYLIAMGAAFLNTWVSMVLFIAMPIVYMLPGAVDEQLGRHPGAGE